MDFLSLQFMILLFFIAILPLYILLVIAQHKPSRNTATDGLRAYPVVGNLPQFVHNRHRLLDWTTEALASSPTHTITFRRLGNVRGVITANPAVVEHILKSGFDNYPKGPRFISHLEDFLGSGIFNADGELWRVQRKTASFEFNTRSLRNFVVNSVQSEISGRLLPLLTKSSKTGLVIDLQDVLERFAFDNVCKVAFGVDPRCLANEREERGSRLASGFVEAFRDAAGLSAGRFRYVIPNFWKIKKLFNIGSERRLQKSIATVHDFAMQIILSRKKESKTSSSAHSADDLLSRFIANGNSSEEFLRDIVISFILAGRETTSSALTWFFWLLSSRPDVEANIMKEIRLVRSGCENSGSKCFEFDELKEMHYLHAAISEAMRLYPPVPVNSSACRADEVLPDGTEIKKGWFISYMSYAMGRMASIWGEDCNEYKPERWIDEAGEFKPESPFKYPVFHAGQRMCLGKDMAYIQMKSIAACGGEMFEVEVVDPRTPPDQTLSLTLRMKGGLPVRVRHRRP